MRNTKLFASMSLGLILALSACTAAAPETTAASAAATTAAATSAAETTAASGETTAAGASTAETTAASGGFDVEKDKAAIQALDPVRPEVLGTITLGEYKNLEFEGERAYQVTPDDVEYYVIYNLMPNFTEEVDTIEFGDTANINYEGLKDGVAFEGGTAENHELVIGSGSFIDGFEDGLIGKKKGEEVELNLTFPEDYRAEDLAGQSVVFKVKVNSIRRQSTLTDELAHQIDENVNTVDELKASIKQAMQESYDQQAMQAALYNAALAAADNAQIEFNEEAVQWKLDDMIKNYYAPYAEQAYGMDLATVLLFQGMSYDSFRASLRESAETAVRQIITLDAIAQQEGIQADDAAIDAYAERYGLTRQMIEAEMGAEMLKHSVVEDLANRLVVDNGTINYPPETTAAAETAASEAAESSAAN